MMASTQEARAMGVAGARPQHRRNKSASSMLKSIISPKSHSRDVPPVNENLPSPQPTTSGMSYDPFSVPILPPNHPHAGQRVLGEIHNQSKMAPMPKKAEEKRPGLHKKTKSSVSLRSLGKDKEKEKSSKDDDRSREQSSPKKPKKTKSSTNLAGLLGKGRSSKDKDENRRAPKDQENTTPPGSAVATVHTPIWAEFSSQPMQEVTSTTKVPLNDARTFRDEIALYTPVDYSPGKQRNFHGPYQPTLVQRQPLPRPKSALIIESGSTASLLGAISRKVSGERPNAAKRNSVHEAGQGNVLQSRRTSWEKAIGRKSSEEQRRISGEHTERPGMTLAKKGARVMAAVAAFNSKGKEVEKETPLDSAKIDAEFEVVLDSRNIPADLRPKMRALTTRVKADFIRSHQVDTSSAQSTGTPSAKGSGPKFALWGETTSKKPTEQARKSSDGDYQTSDNVLQEGINSSNANTKRSRPRSRTFTFSKNEKPEKRDPSPSKKQKSERSTSSKSIVVPTSPSSTSLASPEEPKAGFFSKTPKAAMPADFVAYLRKIQQPETVEVGRIHKLRLLLRNETVAWVDSFIQQGGMTEIVELLYRIMKVEWREEHEDNLLHESLLCLKGLCTTDLALEKLREIESTLFPALIAMLFDEEHKGPSEFTTRQIIINLLFSHLSAASPADLPSRARTVLSYVTDPTKPEEDRPVQFVLQMRQPRPYRVWCREISNVTKEVFWIFLHHLNVIPMPQDSQELPVGAANYCEKHFPKARPPVPAAPYVGGVEWDATNYLSSHLDLLNGILASLPTKADRNALRTELRASGFEKIMGGTLRTCKEKFYGSVHDGLRTWVAAALDDDWPVSDIRMGVREDRPASPKKGSPKKKVEDAPKLDAPKMELPKLSLGLNGGANSPQKSVVDDWV